LVRANCIVIRKKKIEERRKKASTPLPIFPNHPTKDLHESKDKENKETQHSEKKQPNQFCMHGSSLTTIDFNAQSCLFSV